jgi:hypothetical protein
MRGVGQLGRCQSGAAGESLVQAKPIAQDDQRGMIGGSEVVDGPTYEVVQSLVVDHAPSIERTTREVMSAA